MKEAKEAFVNQRFWAWQSQDDIVSSLVYTGSIGQVFPRDSFSAHLISLFVLVALFYILNS